MAVWHLASRVRRRLREDLSADPYLIYILALTFVLAGFWFWHRIPSFATRDEMDRLLDPMVAFGTVLGDPSVESLREGVTWGRAPFGATFYLFGLALVPVLVAAFLAGDIDLFLAFRRPDPEFGYWAVWHATPEWVWTWSLAFVRLFNVAFAVGCVYLTYRIATTIRDRTAGRLAALLLTLSFGFLTIAHEGGEDMPALFFVLLALYLLLAYVRTGDGPAFLAAGAAGGLAIGFKLTAAPIVPAVGAAFLLRGHQAGAAWRSELLRPRLLLGGATLGLSTILLSFPTLLVGGVEPFVERVFVQSVARTDAATGPDAPTWWWFLRQYFQGFGLPLFVGTLGGVAATALRLDDPKRDVHGTALVVLVFAGYVSMLARFHDFRLHHLLPTFPLLLVLLGVALADLREHRPRVGRAAVALLVVSGGAYAGVGTLGYADSPRDAAVAWLEEEVDDDATLEVYRWYHQDAAVPHGMDVNPAWDGTGPLPTDACPEYVELTYRDLLSLSDTSGRNAEERAAYVRGLIEGRYGYEIVAEFGPRPTDYTPDRPDPGSFVELLAVGIYPHSTQYADEQELRPDQWTAILKRTEPCETAASP